MKAQQHKAYNFHSERERVRERVKSAIIINRNRNEWRKKHMNARVMKLSVKPSPATYVM
jgi:hypothetical protein